ncbi:hypothetical protein ACPXCG_13280 [Gordonia sp. DT218]|uniref:hypothetical protein n=1 Tax=unclassified Gordonia (in: high G+C Gram-positive bacteria) TaxID=2657482 RepID=UPI003CEB541D
MTQTTADTTPRPTRPVTTWPAAMTMALLAAVAIGVVVLAFLWPVATSSAKDLPVGLVGEPAAVAQVEQNIGTNAPGTFDTTTYATRDEAVSAIKRRDADGAIIVGRTPEVLVASAAGPATVTILKGVAGSLQQQAGAQAANAGAGSAPATVTTTDIVPLAESDPNGSGLSALGFPLVLAGLLGGILIALLVSGVTRRLAALVVVAVVGGIGVTLVTHTWFGFLPGDFLPLCAGISLAVLGTASFVVGMNALIGPAGIGVAAVITMFVGNPLSAATIPVQFLASPWGTIGQYLVPGAGATLVRDLGYFPEADATRSWLVLTAWAVVGVALSALGHFRNREVVHVAAFEEPATD